MKRAVSEGRRQCSFFNDLARVAMSWEGDINRTQAYVFKEHLLVVLKIRSHQPEGEKNPCALAVYVNEAADHHAGAGAQEASVEDILCPAPGASCTLSVCGRANRMYVSHSLRGEGFRQALERATRLRQQGAAAQLHKFIGEGFKYYCFTKSAWGSPALSRFRDVLFGDRLTGREMIAHGRVQSGIGGIVRVWVYNPWTYKMMQAVGNSEEAWDVYLEGGDQVWHTQQVQSYFETTLTGQC